MTQSPGAELDDDFPEMRELLASQKQRHRRLVAGLIVAGVVLLAAGAATGYFAHSQDRPGYWAPALLLFGLGLVLAGRGAVSGLTDVDERVPDNWHVFEVDDD